MGRLHSGRATNSEYPLARFEPDARIAVLPEGPQTVQYVLDLTGVQ